MAISMVILFFIVGLCLPVLLIFSTLKLIRSRRPWVRLLSLLPASIFVFMAYQIYTAFYPREEFYREQWMRNVGAPLPASIVFDGKDATYPDIHGDYSAIAVIRCQKQDVETMLTQVRNNPNFQIDTTKQTVPGMISGFADIVKGVDLQDPSVVMVSYAGPWFRVSILKDGNTVVFERHSS